MRMLLTGMLAVVPVAVLFAQARAPQVKRSNPPALSKPTGYTHVVEVTGPSKMIYISGQIALDKDGNVVGAGDMKAQAEQVFRNLQAALAVARTGRAAQWVYGGADSRNRSRRDHDRRNRVRGLAATAARAGATAPRTTVARIRRRALGRRRRRRELLSGRFR